MGSCYNCLEMKHLKIQCHKGNKTYPLNPLDTFRVSSSIDIECDYSVLCDGSHL